MQANFISKVIDNEKTYRQTDFRNECKIWDFEFANCCAVAFAAFVPAVAFVAVVAAVAAAVAAVVALNFERYRLRSTK